MTEAIRVAFTILLVAGATVGAAWGYTAYNGPLSDEPGHSVSDEGVFLVTYRLSQWVYQTETKEFPQNGQVVFPNIHIPIQNVTRVELILQVATGGPSVNDAYDVRIRDPLGEERSGSHSVPFPQPEGYIRSDTVVTWSRTPEPPAESYRTNHPNEAAEWSAERHTDTSATGDWEGTVSLNQPMIGREGNASLHLRFTWYEAVVLPNTPAPEPTATPVTTDQNTTGNGTGAPFFDALPRTFITSRSVDGDR